MRHSCANGAVFILYLFMNCGNAQSDQGVDESAPKEAPNLEVGKEYPGSCEKVTQLHGAAAFAYNTRPTTYCALGATETTHFKLCRLTYVP